MKKQDLKDGMVVEYRDGQRRTVRGYHLLDPSGQICHSLKHQNDNLSYQFGPPHGLDIVKVWQPNAKTLSYDLVWGRKTTYKVGDRFETKEGPARLIQTEVQMVGLLVDTNHSNWKHKCWTWSHQVGDVNAITENELKKIMGMLYKDKVLV